ncbi:MAG: sulfoxide reductase heme-binding subunit YedZ [Pyrinomonadaceae bacterium]|nr:sulfoxide reductase heme-binding subunit YedZ [Pyrinomonadaceae bacterium]
MSKSISSTPDVKFIRSVLFINALVPLALLGWDAYRKQLGANPIEFATRATGILTLLFLLISLAVTPLRKLTGANWLIKFRRMLGLYAFFYSSLHLLTYVWFDKFFGFRSIVEDVWSRPFIAVGMASFLLMVPLAITSTNNMIKRLGGKRWARLHKSVYLIAIGGVVHFYMIVKSDTRLPYAFGAVLAVLLIYRVVTATQTRPTLKVTSNALPKS